MDLYKAAFILGAVICTGGSPIDSELTCTSGNGKEYRGTIAETWSGKTCQRWLDQSPHKPSFTPQDYPSSGLESNYCRNPNNSKWPFCYTTDPDTRWEYCSVPSCGAELTCTSGNGKEYRGTIAETWSGKTCQRWLDQSPHKPYFTPQDNPSSGLDSNYCRNPNNSKWPFCYTTDPDTRWEYCSVPSCGAASEPPTISPELSCVSADGQMYMGTELVISDTTHTIAHRISILTSKSTCSH